MRASVITVCGAIVSGAVAAFLILSYRWPLWPSLILLLVVAVLARSTRVPCLVGGSAMLGFALAAELALMRSLPPTLDKQPVSIKVQLNELAPKAAPMQVPKLSLTVVETVQLRQYSLAAGSRIRLGNYAGIDISPGQVWQVQAVLRSPRGFVNAGGFDYRRWLLSEHIVATGYIVPKANHAVVAYGSQALLGWRHSLAVRLEQALANTPSRALIKAIVLGDTSDFSPTHRALLSSTGLAHLFVISGLHIGFIAALAWWFGRVLCAVCWHPMAAGYNVRMQALIALIAAIGYALLAGFSLPTVRAVLMVSLVLFAACYRRAYQPLHMLLIAAALMISVDPLVILGMSFWLSFTAVAVLLYAWSSSTPWQTAILGQISIFLAMNLLLSMFDMAIAPLAPVINLVAIPLVTVVLMPLSLAATGLLLLGIDGPIVLVQQLFDWVWMWLGAISQWRYAQMAINPSLPVLLIAAVGLWFGFAYRRWWFIAALLQLPAYSQTPHRIDGLELTVFDVGQGLAVLLRHNHYNLLYDTGAAYPSGFSLAEAVIWPSLQNLGVSQLNTLVVSHGDNDHAGGVPLINTAFKPSKRYAPAQFVATQVGFTDCVGAKPWQHGQVRFSFLNTGVVASENDNSCVLLVELGRFKLLLSGDIEKLGEFALVSQGLPPATVLLVPHHGSRSSSSDAFLAAVRPKVALVSAGFNNRFGHPHADIVRRYQHHGIALISTASSGAITIRVDNEGVIRGIDNARDKAFGFWH